MYSPLPDYTGYTAAQVQTLLVAEDERLRKKDRWKVVVLTVYLSLAIGMMVGGVVGTLWLILSF